MFSGTPQRNVADGALCKRSWLESHGGNYIQPRAASEQRFVKRHVKPLVLSVVPFSYGYFIFG